jgi:hypothetical protein
MDYKYPMTMSHDTHRGPEDRERSVAERAVVLQLLRGDHAPGWSRADLGRELTHLAPAAIDRAIAELQGAGVVEDLEEALRASAAARRLDELELIAI